MKAMSALVLMLAVANAGCEQPPASLRIVSGPPAANQDVAALLASASEAVDTRVRLAPGASVTDGEAALAALDDGTADLAIVENSVAYRHPTVRTVVPLYPSVLHIGVRMGRDGQALRELFDGATVFAGTEQSPARQLLNRMASMYGWSGIEFSYADSLDSDPDIVFVFAPISPSAAPVLDGYALFSLGRPEDVGAGSVADGLSLVAPFLRPFVIPEGTYGRLTPTAIATVAVDTLLVTRAQTARVVVYDVIQAIEMMGPLLVAQRPDLAIDDLEDFDISHLTFPVHAGTLAFRTRNEPGFAERAAGILEVVVTGIIATGTALLALVRYLRGRRKSRIDVLYREALAVRAQVSPSLSAQQRRFLVGQLRALRDRAFSLLISEKLSADESFRILQTLIADVIRELETPNAADELEPVEPSR
jgi:TRAP-type uncharacterized transport system substrate-binding protein